MFVKYILNFLGRNQFNILLIIFQKLHPSLYTRNFKLNKKLAVSKWVGPCINIEILALYRKSYLQPFSVVYKDVKNMRGMVPCK